MTNSMQSPRRASATGIATLGAMFLALACDAGEPDPDEARAAALGPVAEINHEPAHDPASEPGSGSLEHQIMALEPQKTRAGWLRFTDPILHTPEAAPLLLARLDAATDPPAVRAALAEALTRTGADYAGAVSERIPGEADARVRELLVETLGRRADNADAHAGLSAGLQDDEAAVRSAAARVLAQRADGAEFADSLIALLGDSELSVSADAARTLGVLQVEAARDPLAALLDHDHAQLRLNSLRALSRIDPAFTAGVDLERLQADEDQRVSRLASKLREG